MRIRNLVLFLSGVSFVLLGCSHSSVLTRIPEPSQRESQKLIQFRPPKAERWKLENGLNVLYVYNPEIPVITGGVLVRGGGFTEPKHGVASALSSQLREGGAGKYSADELDLKLEELSATINTAIGGEVSTVNFSCLSPDINTVFPLFADVVFKPHFEAKRLDLWKKQTIEDIRRRTDEPWAVAQISFAQLTYGKNSPYGRSLVVPIVNSISREDLVAYHKKLFWPDDAYLMIAGNIQKKDVEQLVKEHFGNWKASGRGLPKLPPVTYVPKPGIYYVDLPLTQASVYIGHQSVPRLTSDMIAIDGFNQLFGSGFFGSRLSRTVRAELGLAYSIFGGIVPGPVKGKTVIAFQTKVTSVGDAITASINELKKLKDVPPPIDELNEVKRSVSNSFVFKFESLEAAASRALNQEILGFPVDFDDTYVQKIQDLTPKDIQQVALNRWDLSKLVIVVVGNSEAYKSLQNLVKLKPEQFKGLPLRKMKFDQILVTQ